MQWSVVLKLTSLSRISNSRVWGPSGESTPAGGLSINRLQLSREIEGRVNRDPTRNNCSRSKVARIRVRDLNHGEETV